MPGKKLIGYSLCLCVTDIVTWNIPLERIDRIVAGTTAQSEEDWASLLDTYCQSYWYRFPKEARATVKALRETGRIAQPRLADRNYAHSIYTSAWSTEP
jgi:hypothetical protein